MQFYIKKKFSLKVEADITKKLSLYVKAGLSIPESLSILSGHIKSKPHIRTILEWQKIIENGRTLDQAFEISDTYGSPYVAVSSTTRLAVALGDKSGTLGDSLFRASQHINKKIALRKKITSATAYPLAILIGTLSLVVGLVVFIFPKIIPLFDNLKVSLPLSTRIIIVVSHVLSQYWHVIMAAIFIAIIVVVCFLRFSERSRQFIQYVLLRLPLVGAIIKLKQVSSIFDALQTLTDGGEQLSEALKTVSGIPLCYEYKSFLVFACEEVNQGRSFAEFIQKNKILFPVYISGVVSAGERTANIELAIRDVAEIVQTELDDVLKVLTATIEPVLMVSMSLLIGFIALSIILPIYGITAHFQNG